MPQALRGSFELRPPLETAQASTKVTPQAMQAVEATARRQAHNPSTTRGL